MSRIEQLIEELCPQGVEYKELGEVSSIFDGTHQTPNYTNEGIKFVSVENISALYETKKYISTVDYDRLYRVKPQLNDIFMTRIGTIGACAIVDRNDDLAFYVTLTLIRPLQDIVNSKFIKYIIESSKGQKELRKRTLIYAVPIKINLGDIGKIRIPIPPLPIQQEIVRILDTFTDLDAELQAELEARKKQYEHYRNQLLNFEEKEVELIPFEDCFEMRNGYTPSKSKSEYWDNGTISWFRMEDLRSNGKILSNSIQKITREAIKGGKLFPANSIIIATSATIGEHALITTEYLSNQRFTCFYPKISYKEKVNMKYMHYYSYLLSDWCKSNTNVSGFASVDMAKFRKLLIPIPPLAEQERVVSILDKFAALVNEELPAEISARRKQYEYYRERLLTFEPLVN